MSIHQSRPFALWVKGVLTAGSVAAEVMKKPASVPVNAGYAVIYPIAGGITGGSLEAPRSDASPNIQVTSIGADEDQALWLADRVRTLLDTAVPAALDGGRRVIWLDFVTASPTGTRDDSVQPPLYVVPDAFEMGTVG